MMKIKLVQSGGFLPLTKVGVTEVDWTKEEAEKFLRLIAREHSRDASMMRDGIEYTVTIGKKEVVVDLDKAEKKFAGIFEELKKNLAIIKT